MEYANEEEVVLTVQGHSHVQGSTQEEDNAVPTLMDPRYNALPKHGPMPSRDEQNPKKTLQISEGPICHSRWCFVQK